MKIRRYKRENDKVITGDDYQKEAKDLTFNLTKVIETVKAVPDTDRKLSISEELNKMLEEKLCNINK